MSIIEPAFSVSNSAADCYVLLPAHIELPRLTVVYGQRGHILAGGRNSHLIYTKHDCLPVGQDEYRTAYVRKSLRHLMYTPHQIDHPLTRVDCSVTQLSQWSTQGKHRNTHTSGHRNRIFVPNVSSKVEMLPGAEQGSDASTYWVEGQFPKPNDVVLLILSFPSFIVP